MEITFNTTITSTTFPMKVTIDNTNYMVDDKGKVEIKEILWKNSYYSQRGILYDFRGIRYLGNTRSC